ncbi:hypothetical protein F441_05325 [Phytophthora nicotianae CJ01A1]|uniref:Uncharacterized protein n=4 Tax=Phytophthora nicotianae TaxID=4792 RepID=V9FJI3_PHYNI|nr:hypothetical protein F443_05323 [Phytophthora nicotianae P1569]ETK91181.1 hypothetical protein L915_05180 [Phytophthora nicotianae]ETL44582.1 hypothetical protein L916_05137 [Phytophthora nicotianae]ETO80035.1 hypothetical protein F444_05370 [Phytophthora nicotianae P1976]ETP21062.1 hypothetical protein F441_05325 [Phytophthora nicotianae CJ01A1]
MSAIMDIFYPRLTGTQRETKRISVYLKEKK